MIDLNSLGLARAGSRRRKLWELDHRHHCQLVGVCFEVAELRRLVSRLVPVPSLISDFELHRSTVQTCQQRGKISELLQKALDKRYALKISQLRSASPELLLQAWLAGIQEGEVGACLWSILTHPRCTEAIEEQVYASLHMLQHQVGAGHRREQAEYQALRSEHAALLRAHAQAQQRVSQERDLRVQEMQALRETLMQTQAERIALQTRVRQLEEQCAHLGSTLPDMADRERLIRRASEAEAHAQALRAHARAQEERARYWETRCSSLAAQRSAELPADNTADSSLIGPPAPDTSGLNGKQVLCIGGRPHVIGFYRQLVEGRGGRFTHHDGGLEENLSALEPSIAAADAVICQAGCINHNAYWRVKDYCKRTGKACVFLKTTGVSSFERELEKLSQ